LQLDPKQVNEHVFPGRFPGLTRIQLVHSEPGKSECRIDVAPEHLNPGGVVHGGATYTMADTGMAFAIMPMLEGNEISTTVEIKISYYKAVREGAITCKTDVLKKGKRIAFLESELRDDAGDIVARANGTYYIIAK
jgi:acyl-CoA thioesterase